jgi:DNA-directed RNA polymerase subunit omega
VGQLCLGKSLGVKPHIKPQRRGPLHFKGNDPLIHGEYRTCSGLSRQETALKSLHDDPNPLYLIIMIFPLEELIEYDGNMYEITSAASRRSFQLSMLKDPDIEMNDGKVVSLAARQIFTEQIEFRIEE